MAKRDTEQQKVKRGAMNARKMTYSAINAGLDRIRAHFGAMDDVTRRFTKEELTAEYRRFIGLDSGKVRRGTTTTEAESLQNALLKFMVEQGQLNGWSEATFKKFRTVGKHWEAYREDLRIGEVDEDALNGFVSYLIGLGFNNNYIKKLSKTTAWFLRWAQKKGYCGNMDLDCLAPRLKIPERRVIHLDWEELMTVYHFQVPTTKNYLARVRDIFCFCCFTGLRYSDAQNLKRSDVYDNSISISTIKTTDSLDIPLSKYAKAVLDRYADEDLGGKALPVISNQKANKYLKELCRLCGIDRPVTVVDYRGNQRIEDVKPKWELIGTHTGRRTFISNALILGVPVSTVMAITGHSDYQAMKPYIAVAEHSKQAAMAAFDAR